MVLCRLFVVGVDQVQLFGIERKLRGRLMRILLTLIRQPQLLNKLGRFGRLHRLRCDEGRTLEPLNALFKLFLLVPEDRCGQVDLGV